MLFTARRAMIVMNVTQLMIAGVAIVLVIVIVLLAVIPSLLDYPRGRDKDESDKPAPTPLKPDDRHDDHSVDLAA
jgi:membrane protein YdbS with pleckstrin-like domain